MIHTPNIQSHSGEKIGFAILGIGSHLGLSTKLNFISLKPCSLVMLHVKFENHGCSDFRK